jgi:hypothetical protein
MSQTKNEVENKTKMNRTLSENLNKLEDINNFKSNMKNAIDQMFDI